MPKGRDSESIRAKTLEQVWELINNHGISIIPEASDKIMDVTVGHRGKGDHLAACVTFSRSSEPGILFWLTDKEWQSLKKGKL